MISEPEGRIGQLVPVSAPPVPVMGAPWSVRVPRGEADIALIQHWMREPHVVKYWQQDWERERWRAEITGQIRGDHSLPCLLMFDGAPLAYLEIYRVMRDRLAPYYAYKPHDLGVHIAIGDAWRTGKGLGSWALRSIVTGLFEAEPHCHRVVAEPDTSNASSVAAFRAAGFRPIGEIVLPEKIATLMIRRRNGS